MAGIPILKELERLKNIHQTSKVSSAVFQPNQSQQKAMILHNISSKLVSYALKKEVRKYKEQVLRRQLRGGPNNKSVKDFNRATTAPTTGHGHFPRAKGASQRPFTSNADSGSTSGEGKADFSSALKSAASAEKFQNDLNEQIYNNMKDAYKVFNALYTVHKGGLSHEFSPNNEVEYIDATEYATPVVASLLPINPMKLLDDGPTKKKEGVVIVLDPALNTHGEKVTLRVTYKKVNKDDESEETVEKDYEFWGTGSYYGLRLTAVVDQNYPSDATISLPGWQGRAPIMIPNMVFTVQLIKNNAITDYSLAFKLSVMRIHMTTGMNMKQGIKKLIEFCNEYFVSDTANIVVSGRVQGLQLAALHGNMNAVVNLVTNGADVNYRNADSRYTTPLHEAVIGGHAQVVKYLLDSGANQLLRDEIGCTPMHRACMSGNITIVNTLVNARNGKKALLTVNNNDKMPIEVTENNFLKARVEAAMKRLKIFSKPRVSILDR